MLHSIVMLAQLMNNNALVVDACKRELQVLAEEWNVTRGEQVDSLKETIKINP